MKKGLLVVLVLIMVLGLVGCSSTPAEETNTAEPTETTPIETESQTSEPTPEPTVEPTPEPIPEPLEELPMGETITIDDVAEITVDSTKYQNEPEYGNTIFRVLDKNEGDTCFVVFVKYKNLGTEVIDHVGNFVGSGAEITGITFNDLVYNDKYHYTAEARLGDDISPLATGTVIYYYVIPQEVEKAEESLIATVEIDGKEYTLTVR